MLKTRANQLTVLIAIACLFGGGGVAYGLANLAVQLAALIILALNGSAMAAWLAKAPRSLTALVLVTLAVPLIQLVPMPQAVWTSLPGRTFVEEALRVVGASGWQSLSFDPARTFVAFTGLIAPFTVIALGWRAEGNGTGRIAMLIIAMGIANVFLGTAQVLGHNNFAVPYIENEMPGVLFGFFANRNTTGIFLVCCLLLLVSLPPRKVFSLAWQAKIGTAVVLATGVVLTQSRTSIVLLAIPLALAVIRFVVLIIAQRQQGMQRGNTVLHTALGAALAGIVVAGGMATFASGSRVDTVLARFEKTQERRPSIWEDSRYAAARYWPVGSGMGTFDEVFQQDESLEYVTERRAGRAHNDYLEIAIEAGILAIAVAAAWALWVAYAAWRAITTPQRWPALAGAGILIATALQSLLDYPLRNQAMLCVAAFAVVLLAPVTRRKWGEQATSEHRP